MSEQINKLLCTIPQSFTTAEQKIGRDNIDAQQSITYSYSGSTITAIDGSAIGGSVDMSGYVPFSAISADENSAITSINGSSVGNFTGVSSDNNISGDGTSGSPIGLNSSVSLTGGSFSAEYTNSSIYMTSTSTSTIYANEGWRVRTTSTASNYRSVTANCSGIEVNWDTDHYVMQISASGLSVQDSWNPSHNRAEFNYDGAIQSSYLGKSSTWNESSLNFYDSASATQTVDASSIARWNAMSADAWRESANSLSTGFGGNQAVSASQYNYGDTYANWACRKVYAVGSPEQSLFGFQTPPSDSSKTYAVRGNGHFTELLPQSYFIRLLHVEGAALEDLGSSLLPSDLSGDAKCDIVNLCSGYSATIVTDTYNGSTAVLKPGDSATMYYLHDIGEWTDGVSPVPVPVPDPE